MSAQNDDQVLALAARIRQLRSAEADIKKAEQNLQAAIKTRDDLQKAVDKLRSGQTSTPAPAPAPSPGNKPEK